MARLTFRADDEMIRQMEEMDGSRSEVMREALRQYLSTEESSSTKSRTLTKEQTPRPTFLPNINVNVQFSGNETQSDRSEGICQPVSTCDCGNEVREAWAFCPECGRRARKREI